MASRSLALMLRRIGCARVARSTRTFLALLFTSLAWTASVGAAEEIRGDLKVSATSGYARLVFTFAREVESEVRLVNGIVIIAFKTPVDVSVDNVATNAPGYVSVARRDPDGGAVRLALSRKVTVNSMVAAERLFVDLLPENWTGVAPGLPQEVVEELARRAREAEQKARKAELLAQKRQFPPVRVRVGKQPTFTRYVFEMPELIPVAADRANEKLTLVFDAPLKFDLADAKAALPATVQAINAESKEDTASVVFAFTSKADVRTFREDNNFVIDVSAAEGKGAIGGAPLSPKTGELPSLIVVPADDKPAAENAGDDRKAAQESGADKNGEAAAAGEAGAHEPPQRAIAFPPVVGFDHDPMAGGAPATRGPSAASGPARDESGAAALAGRDPAAPVVARLHRKGDAVQLVFPFAQPTPAAVFRRFDTLWLVFDTKSPIAAAALVGEPSRTIRNAEVSRVRDGQIVRIKLERPRLATAALEGGDWTIELGDVILAPTAPLSIARQVAGPGHPSSVIAFDQPLALHRVADPDIGDALFVVTALGPARGFLRGQDFVEFRALPSIHGVAIQPLADDVTAEILSDKIVVTRPNGLVLSALPGQKQAPSIAATYQPTLFNADAWSANREAAFGPRQMELLRTAALATQDKRNLARFELAKFYLGRDLFPEARAVLDVALGDGKAGAEDGPGLVLRAVANVMMERGEEALKDLAHPLVGGRSDVALWRALAFARQGHWAEARGEFKAAETAIALLPADLQRFALKEALRVAVEVKDFTEATRALHELETVGVSDAIKPAVSVLSGRLAEGLGRLSDALSGYRGAARSWDRAAAAEGRLRETLLRHTLKEIDRAAAIAELETLTTTWRGDDTEVEALQLLGRLYTEENRYRDAFYAMRTALSVRPQSPVTRRIQEEMAATFDSLFLAGKGDSLPAIEALSLFYDFRELMPIGRRGDEMIRRLADRLVSVDLLEQAAELLQHQIEHRLQGAARAQVASRLAVVHLLARKPDQALRALQVTRSGELNNELRTQRLLLEARALSDAGRHDVAMEVVAGLEGPQADRVRADVLWRARRFREASEQIEKLYGERWRDFAPLSDAERPDILRAAVGFVLGEDRLGLARFREKYAGKMAEGPDAKAFELLNAPGGTASAEFRAIAKAAIGQDTLEQFLRDMRARYPEAGAVSPVPTPQSGAAATGATAVAGNAARSSTR